MSNLRHDLVEPENHVVTEFATSHDYSYNDFINSNKDLLLNSFSATSPTDHNLKLKTSKPSNDYERVSKEKKKVEKENYLLSENLRKVY